MAWITALLVSLAGAAAAAQSAAEWRDAPEFLPLFAPAGARAAAYRAYVSSADLDTVLRRLDGDPALVRAPGAWRPVPVLPADAFGQTGAWDRWAVARLYGGGRARVARGPRLVQGRVVESWTLISPHPDSTLGRLEPGTLLLVVPIP